MLLVKHTGTGRHFGRVKPAQQEAFAQQAAKPGSHRAARWFFYIFSLVVFVLVIFYFPAIRRDFRLLRDVKHVWLGAAVLLQLSGYFFTALVYRVLLRACNAIPLPSPFDLYRASVILLFFNQTIPSAGVSGNSFLFNYLRKRNLPAPQIISLILVELLTYYAGVLFVTLCLLAVALAAKFPGPISSILAGGLVVYVLFSAAVLWAGRKNAMEGLRKKLGGVKWLRKMFNSIGEQFSASGIYDNSISVPSFIKHHPAAMAKSFGLQLALFATDVFTITVLFQGIGVPVSLLVISLAVIGSRIITVLPFSPGGLILYESGMSFVFVTFGVPIGTAVMVTLLFRVLSFWLPMPAGFLLYRRWLRKTKSI